MTYRSIEGHKLTPVIGAETFGVRVIVCGDKPFRRAA